MLLSQINICCLVRGGGFVQALWQTPCLPLALWRTNHHLLAPHHMALLNSKCCAYDNYSLFLCKFLRYPCKQRMPSNVEYASTEAKIRRLPVKYVDVSTEFPVSVSADSVLMVSRALWYFYRTKFLKTTQVEKCVHGGKNTSQNGLYSPYTTCMFAWEHFPLSMLHTSLSVHVLNLLVQPVNKTITNKVLLYILFLKVNIKC